MKMAVLSVAVACLAANVEAQTQARGWEMFYEKNSWGEPTSDRATKSPIADSTTVRDLKAMLFVGCQAGVYVDIALERAGWRDDEALEVSVKLYPHDSRTAETKYEVEAVRDANMIKFREPIKLLRAMAGKGITSEPQRRIGIKIPWQGRRQAAFFWDISQSHLREACPNYLW